MIWAMTLVVLYFPKGGAVRSLYFWCTKENKVRIINTYPYKMTTTQFRETFSRFKISVVDGVPGVICIKSNTPGPVLGITACTHGNESSGLAIFEYLLKEKNIEKELKCGTLYLVVNNIQAAEKFFNATSEEQIRKARYCDVNMNRLPKETLQLSSDARYELVRARELYPIWKRFEFALDVHSTLEPSDPTIVSRGGEFHSNLVRGFPIKKLISNIDKIQIGAPAFAFYGGLKSETRVFAIEAGQHSDPGSFERAKGCAVSLLKNLGMLHGTPEIKVVEYEEYKIVDSVIFPDKSFDFIKSFNTFDEIHKGDLLARNTNGEMVRAPFDGHLILPSSLRGEEKYILEEATFISLPMKVRKVY